MERLIDLLSKKCLRGLPTNNAGISDVEKSATNMSNGNHEGIFAHDKSTIKSIIHHTPENYFRSDKHELNAEQIWTYERKMRYKVVFLRMPWSILQYRILKYDSFNSLTYIWKECAVFRGKS